jgi:hypothetical protein
LIATRSTVSSGAPAGLADTDHDVGLDLVDRAAQHAVGETEYAGQLQDFDDEVVLDPSPSMRAPPPRPD